MHIIAEDSERMTLASSATPRRIGVVLIAVALLTLVWFLLPIRPGNVSPTSIASLVLVPFVIGSALLFVGTYATYTLDRTTQALTIQPRTLMGAKNAVVIPFREINDVAVHKKTPDGRGIWTVRFKFTTPHPIYGLEVYTPDRARHEEVAACIRNFLSKS